MAKKSKFNLSHERKLSLNMGQLVPIICDEVLPGDRFRVNSEVFLRFAPLLAPVMHRVKVYTHYFFIPNRLLWNQWEDFITGGKNGDLAPVPPFLSFPSVAAPDRSVNGSLADYLGLPTIPQADVPTVTNTFQVSALPFRAYQKVYNDYYRDQNLSDPVAFSLNGGAVAGQELLDITSIRKRAWEKDYFTSALPWAQRGGEAGVPIDYTENLATKAFNATANVNAGAQAGFKSDGSGNIEETGSSGDIRFETEANIFIRELRKAARLQEWLEKNARAGSRYVEQLLAHWGVRSSDQRLQRSEYLGGGVSPVVISEVLSNFQFSGDAQGLPQGNMAGHAISAGNTNGFNRQFEEHGWIIGIMSVIPATAYQQGIHRKWFRTDKFDFAWPTFAQIGEQEVVGRELYVDYKAAAGSDDGTFGYQERYAEYKYGVSSVHGNMRDNLAYWHMGRIFSAQPQLNESFVMSDPTTRIFAVEDPGDHHLYCQLYNHVSAIRKLPYHGTPSL